MAVSFVTVLLLLCTCVYVVQLEYVLQRAGEDSEKID